MWATLVINGLTHINFHFRGKFAVVKKCVHTTSGDTYAAKMVKYDEDTIDIVRKEFDIWRELSHPNLVLLHDAYLVRKYLILICDIVKGIPVMDYLTRFDTLTENEVANCIQQLLLALEYMHQLDIVHLDIKVYEKVYSIPYFAVLGSNPELVLRRCSGLQFFSKYDSIAVFLLCKHFQNSYSLEHLCMAILYPISTHFRSISLHPENQRFSDVFSGWNIGTKWVNTLFFIIRTSKLHLRLAVFVVFFILDFQNFQIFSAQWATLIWRFYGKIDLTKEKLT